MTDHLTSKTHFPFYGHDDGLVIDGPDTGFKSTPMTPAQLAAREPALAIAKDIYRHANQAGICYAELWNLIAKEMQKLLDERAAHEPAGGLTAPMCPECGWVGDFRTSPPPSAWRPIETAPQGDAIVWLPHKGAVMARLCGDLWYDLTTGWLCEPTLWAPMPAGPSETKNSVETAPEGRGVRDNPPPHALGSSEGADTHSRLSEPDAANVAKPHDDPTAHRVADLRAQSQPTDEPSDDLAFPLDARVREVFGQTEGTIVAIDSRYEVECTDGKHRFYWHRQLERVAETKDAGECGACDKPGEHR